MYRASVKQQARYRRHLIRKESAVPSSLLSGPDHYISLEDMEAIEEQNRIEAALVIQERIRQFLRSEFVFVKPKICKNKTNPEDWELL